MTDERANKPPVKVRGQGLRRADLPQGQPAAPGPQRADPDRAGHRRHLPGLDEVDPVPEPLRAPRRLQERGQHPQGLPGPDRRRQRRQGREREERLRQRPDRQLRQQLLRGHLHGRRPTASRSTATRRSRSGRASSWRATSSSTCTPAARARTRSRAATRSRSPRPRRRSSSTRSSPRCRRPTGPTCRSCSRATARRSPTSRPPPTTSTQDPEVQGLTAAAGDQQVLRLRTDRGAGLGDRQRGAPGHRPARPLQPDRGAGEGLRRPDRPRVSAPGPDHQLQHGHRGARRRVRQPPAHDQAARPDARRSPSPSLRHTNATLPFLRTFALRPHARASGSCRPRSPPRSPGSTRPRRCSARTSSATSPASCARPAREPASPPTRAGRCSPRSACSAAAWTTSCSRPATSS